MFVEPQKGNLRRVRTPPIRAKISAPVNLFLVNPIQSPIQNLVTAIARQRAFATLHAQIFDVEISSANEANHSSIGTETGADFFFRIASETNCSVAAELV